MVVVVVVVVMILIMMIIIIMVIWRVVIMVNKECLYLLPLVLCTHNIQGLIILGI